MGERHCEEGIGEMDEKNRCEERIGDRMGNRMGGKNRRKR